MATTLRRLLAIGVAAGLIGLGWGAPGASAAPSSGASLALMPIGAAEFGGLADGLAVGADSGAETAAHAAAVSSQACQTPAGIRRSGWLGGQILSFDDVSGQALRRRAGVLGVNALVQRYTDGASAARAIALELAADRAGLGERSPQGGRVLAWRSTPVPDLGPEARLVEGNVGLGAPRLWFGYVVARQGELLTFVAVARADARSSRAALIQAARNLRARIDAVRLGQIKEPAAGTPAAPAPHPARPRRARTPTG